MAAPPPNGSPQRVALKGGASESPPDTVARIFGNKVQAVAEKVVEQAEAGDVQSMRMVLDRLAPAQKDRAVKFALPAITGAKDLPAAVLAVMGAIADGAITPAEGQQLAAMLEQYRKHIETKDLAERIEALEQANGR